MTVSRTPKNKTQEDNQDQMFEPPFAMQFEDDEKKVDEPDERDEKINSLSTQLAEMQRRLEETARTNVAMISHTESEVFQPEREIQVPDLNEDTAGHIQAVTQNALIKDRNERRRADWERKQNESIDDKVKALWDDFGTRHPELAAVPQERIEYAATEVAKKAKGRGLDPQKYMFITTDRFLDDVAKQYVAVFGEPKVDEDDLEEDNRREARRAPTRKSRARSEDDGDDGRSASIFSGAGTGRRGKGKSSDEDEAGSMIDDLQDFQRKSGFF